MLKQFQYARPKTLQEATEQLQRAGSVIHAGGTDLLGCLRDGVFDATRVVSLSALAGLKFIRQASDGGLEIGAMVPLAEVAEHEIIRARYTALAEAAASAASPQLRAQGTLAGNLCQRPRCWYYRGDFHCLRKGGDICYAAAGENQYHCIFGGGPCYIVHPSDTAAALIALDAKLTITGPGGNSTLPLDSFFVLPEKDVIRENVLKPGEIITSIVLPPVKEGSQSCYRKMRERASWDFALAGIAIRRYSGSAKVVLSGVAPVPWRVPAVEAILAKPQLHTSDAKASADAAVAGASPLEHNEYKVRLVHGLVMQTVAELK